MNKKPIISLLLLLITTFCFGGISTHYLKNWPKDSNPAVIGKLISYRFLNTPYTYFGNPTSKTKPEYLTYPDVCTWIGALWFARESNDVDLQSKLHGKFQQLINNQAGLALPPSNHVDNSIFGALPLELYLQTRSQKYRQIGLYYADNQWHLPDNWTLEGQPKRTNEDYGMLSDAHIFQPEQKQFADSGYSWQTRFWLDDMFMITTLQGQAFKVTGNGEYIEKAANEMSLYLKKLQLQNGLFNHAPNIPFRWGRGNGWMAVGMTDILKLLPNGNIHKEFIMSSYKKMMASLYKYQGNNGLWKQLIDDKGSWDETSCSAMFVYAFIIGVKEGWLSEYTYGRAARKGWLALVKKVNINGDVSDVCEGTNTRNSRDHYMSRKRITGDLHGQAPVLWCAYALLK